MLSATSRIGATGVTAIKSMGVRCMSTKIENVGVVGLGLMGHGIAQTAAEAGFKVVAIDADDAAERGMGMIQGSLETVAGRKVKKGLIDEAGAKDFVDVTMGNITTASDIGALADCDIVVEAIIEDIDIKTKLYEDLGKTVKESGILASNTSSLAIEAMAGPSGRPDRMVGLHFFNPVQMMKLVEVVRTDATSEEVFETAMQFGTDLGKTAVPCKDTPGFVVNRLLVPYMAQSLAMLDRGDATAEDIDTAMQLGAGVPMGPITLADYVGLDTCLFILEGWVRDFPDEPAFIVPDCLRAKVAAGQLGRKTGQGFYTWAGNKKV